MEQSNNNNYLEHHGILGMHWGHHKARTTSVPSEDYLRKTRLKKMKVSEMSNSELRSLTERMQLEKQYKDLSKSEISAGRKFAQDILLNIGKEIATNAVRDLVKDVTTSVKDNDSHTVTNALSDKLLAKLRSTQKK